MARPTILQPPELTLEEISSLTAEVRDLQISRGSVIKVRPPPEDNNVISSPTTRPIGISLFPTAFPRRLFDQAGAVQEIYHELYAAAIRDVDWLESVLRPLIDNNETAALLWKVHQSVQAGQGSVKGLQLGIWRGDFMLHVSEDGSVALKMVEFNTISCAGGAHSDMTTMIHRKLCLRGRSRHHQVSGRPHRAGFDGILVRSNSAQVADTYLTELSKSVSAFLDPMPDNDTIQGTAFALETAYQTFNDFLEEGYNPRKPPKVDRCVLIIIQPASLNAADERPIEDALWNMEHVRIPTYRLELSQVLARTELGQSGELLFKPLLSNVKYEVAVVYYRAGHAITTPNRDGGVSFEARVRIERSRAIKCPSVIAQMCTFKTVQCALARPQALFRLLKGDEHKIRAIQDTQVKMFTLDESEGQILAKRILAGQESTANWVLKPAAAEGGGNNTFGDDLIPALQAVGQPSQYTLMQRIKSPAGIKNYLSLGNGQVYVGDVISELGIFGKCMFPGPGVHHRYETIDFPEDDSCRSDIAGWSFKSKRPEIDEMSVVKGYGAFDTPYLVDDDEFASRTMDGHT